MFYFKVLSVLLLCSIVAANDAVEINKNIIKTHSNDSDKTHEKIVGGKMVSIHEVPYMVSVRSRAHHENKYGRGHLCGGAVLSRRMIASAAHCFAKNMTFPVEYYGAENYVIVAGGRKLAQLEGLTQIYLVEQIITHGDFRPETLENDIALMFINSMIPYNYLTIRPVDLAEHPFPQGTMCSITGWGDNGSELLRAYVPIVHPRLCNLIYMNLPKSQLCAGWLQGGIDACKGDSGGPLVCEHQLTGIISWGVDCGRFFFPGVYTNVTHFIDWIKQANNTLNYTQYQDLRSLNSSRSSFRCLNINVILSAFLCMIIMHVK